jgi:D-alanine-D-alanine ligase
MKVAVLMGGMSAERDVSLQTGKAIAGALRELGHDAVEVDVDRQLGQRLAEVQPDAAFMALHGRGGEDGTVQGLLEIMRIPYTGCGVLSSAMTMDKVVTKEILAYHERFVKGRLFTVGVLGDEPVVLPILEIRTAEGFYDYEAKYQPGMSEYEVPAKLDPEVTEEARRITLESFKCLFCRGISRIDLMLEDVTGKLYVLEVNTIPGMTATSLVPKAAAAIGMTFNEVVAGILAGASLKVDLSG